MTTNGTVSGNPHGFSIVELLKIACSGYPDEYLNEYFDPETGAFKNEGWGGDTLAEFIVRELQETFDCQLPKAEQATEACRVLRRAIGNLESVIAAVEKHIQQAA